MCTQEVAVWLLEEFQLNLCVCVYMCVCLCVCLSRSISDLESSAPLAEFELKSYNYCDIIIYQSGM